MLDKPKPPATSGPKPLLQPPILDASGHKDPIEGTGGGSASGVEQIWDCRPRKRAAHPVVGEIWDVETADPPGDFAPPWLEREGDGTRLLSFRFNLDFKVAASFWTNRAEVDDHFDAPSCRLYAHVATGHWTLRCRIDFDPATGEPVGGLPKKQTMIAHTGLPVPGRRALPLDRAGHETRFPIILRSQSTIVRKKENEAP